MGRKEKYLVKKISHLLQEEVQFFGGLFRQLHEKISVESGDSNDSTVFDTFISRIQFYIQHNTCLEVALNAISSENGFSEINTHNTNLEHQILNSKAGSKLGRDFIVRTIWKWIKKKATPSWENFNIVKNPSFSAEDWGEYNVNCPLCNTRFFSRSREVTGRHEDGTERWYWNYEVAEEHWGCYFAMISDNYDAGVLEDSSYDSIFEFLIEYASLSAYDILREVATNSIHTGDEEYLFYEDFYNNSKFAVLVVKEAKKVFGRSFPNFKEAIDLNDYLSVLMKLDLNEKLTRSKRIRMNLREKLRNFFLKDVI